MNYSPNMAAKTSAKTSAWYKKELDRVFSIFIRQRDKGVCFTCGNVKNWKYQQNGHYVSRAHMSLRFDEINCNAQCQSCNIFRNGNMDEYALALIRKHGDSVLDTLSQKKNTIRKWSIPEFQERIEYYKTKIHD